MPSPTIAVLNIIFLRVDGRLVIPDDEKKSAGSRVIPEAKVLRVMFFMA
jgi:hypothetical protein